MTSVSSFHDLPASVRISSFCSDGDCVGVAVTDDGVAVVDTKSPGTAPLCFSPSEWAAFVAGVKAGEFDTGGPAVMGPPVAESR